MTIREEYEKIEKSILHERATLSSQSKGRLKKEEEDDIRTAFQRDRDRIIHSKAFRRLKHKTQVFFSPQGDHYRTRLTHVLEVSQIARTIARALRLNEDLTEAIALGHDLGHTPFGHAGEAILREIHPEGFEHYEQSLRVVDFLEKNGEGLNLTFEVRDGIVNHSKGKGSILSDTPKTLEGQIVRVADIIAYLNHDLDDAIRAGIIKNSDIPLEFIKIFGDRHSKRINTMVRDVIFSTIKADYEKISMSPLIEETLYKLRDFLFEKVYENEVVLKEFRKAKYILESLYSYYIENPSIIFGNLIPSKEEIHRAVCDFIAGMTDRYALYTFEKIFIPKSWFIS
ncbi:MAG: deoxyguanosinetriphosphate triphosphohydrolase [Thermodesulfovibrio sp.]|uniref:deoxyguanosinetriphosphate triphosphohydrolase n=1 Tax=unclassified Thermodesulfovibrio TaxID=2645936 RepID=UPI00083A3525|nr:MULTISPECIES: deoxyguanosinetriphosphate triphosphohydrolase [unclassified Thermodesulfovibrio]MDI1470983.1 deoxyguanosinetriphosphate triphosphohydrolase [Thermodesulfovibrio sp. 1176]MDI6713833.1 deoxyguanosinetriphosphate triphosphohydrolase [Thermodesulfovibrio sp.]ODA43774.1 Deoxyguanosinetriphosphate triphosphohydrolase [Thermodesulfovibrio sp. N1]